MKSTLALAAAGALCLTLVPRAALAHCDTLDGPVVKAARLALAKGDVTGVLKWVPAADEAEIRRAFAETLKVRALGPAAAALADRYFFETLVRVHRASEGEPYTGLKPEGTDPGPAIAGADRALETGSVDALVTAIAGHVAAQLRERFAHAREALARADESVEAGRAFVRAYVGFVHYAERVHQAGEAGAHEHTATPAPNRR